MAVKQQGISVGRVLMKNTQIGYDLQSDTLTALPAGGVTRVLERASECNITDVIRTVYGAPADLRGGDSMQQFMLIMSGAVLYEHTRIEYEVELTRLRGCLEKEAEKRPLSGSNTPTH
mgnify:CR=1 FL=1